MLGKRRISGRMTWICQDKSYLITMRADRGLEVVEVVENGDGIRNFVSTFRKFVPLFEVKKHTPPKINIEPENDGLEDVSPFPGVYSQVPC